MYSLILTILHQPSGRSTVTVVNGFENANAAIDAGNMEGKSAMAYRVRLRFYRDTDGW